VVVRPGDSLWAIAAARLGADASQARVAAEWPRWYATNHDSIGADPALIKPGQLLHAPAEVPAR
jgi:nucleoid-associated protein YgaU